MPVDYREVITDLRNKATLMNGLADTMEQAIFGKVEDEGKPEETSESWEPNLPIKTKGTLKPRVAQPGKQETIASIILRVAGEPKDRNALDFVNRVMEIRPNAHRPTVDVTLRKYLRKGILMRDTDGIVRMVVAGKIQFPPPEFSINTEAFARP